MRGLRVLFITVVAVAGTAGLFPVEAQRSNARVRAFPEIGVRAGRDFSVDTWTAGAHIRIPFGRALEFRPSADLALEDIGDDFQINGDLALRGPADQAYIGAGVGYVNREFESGKDSGTGLNLFVGFRPIPRAGSQIYLEGRWTFVESETIFRVGMGVTIPL
jgi:hypothetical protein